MTETDPRRRRPAAARTAPRRNFLALASWIGGALAAAALLLFPVTLDPLLATLAAAALILLPASLQIGRPAAALLLFAFVGLTLQATMTDPVLPDSVAIILGLSLLLRGLAAHPVERTRPMLAILSYGLVAASVVMVLVGQAPGASLMLACSGLGVIALLTYWSQASHRHASSRGWEPVVLLALLAANAWAALVFSAAAGWVAVPGLDPWRVPLAAATVALAAVAAPVPAPTAFTRLQTPLLDVAAHGSVAIALLNVLFLCVTISSNWSLKAILVVLLGWQLMVLGLEFRTLHHVERRRRKLRPDPPASREPITVVVPAADEAKILPDTMRENLAIDHPIRFLLVPAAKSRDATVEVAHRIAAENPDRVAVVVGDTGTKAGDLNKAWARIETPLVLMLDADETIDRRSLHEALAALASDPSIGVVQGRKVSRAPEDGALARFVTAERRYATWMDHVMHGEELGSSHFGGSAALLRREIVPAIGGWTAQTVTEDIEFTLRLHLDGRWRIVYDPEMVVREADPATFADLLRQRSRWSRGWAQCFNLYAAEVVAARRRLGAKRAFGLLLLLLLAVSALWTTFLPATVLTRLAGYSPLLPLVVALPMSLVLLPSRFVLYGYAALNDPVVPIRRRPREIAELALHAYLWILLGWFVQLHALYLEFSSAPHVWHITGKRPALAPVGGAEAGPTAPG